ncbi:AAA family ATPase [Cupriavidus numazuensis]|uniref:AAA domain-containing protein n=1 Tax=Cupriavidus numazuensis TaxID=221992 RepID=A0ABN7Q4L7_9BURK|nr:AAA family ATPase [Cupriavidus numazuensis]CAG2156806.1 hypothetical protein LMG26411_05371 [Cupriavidus numazuensis]
MAKLLLISADETCARQLAALAGQVRTTRQVRMVCATPEAALATQGLIHPADFVVLQADDFSPALLDKLRQRFHDPDDMPCMLVTQAPGADLLMRAMRAGVRSVQCWPPEEREFCNELERLASKNAAGAESEAHTMAFVSCKGGSGTTFTASNFAYALAALRGKRVLLVDLVQQFGDAAFLVTDKTPPATLADLCAQVDRLDLALLDACITHAHPNFDVIAGAGDPVRAGEIKGVHMKHILELVRPVYDVLIFDIGQDINPSSIVVLDQSDTIYPVLQPSLPYLRAGRLLMSMLRSLGYPSDRLHIVVNQFEKHAAVTIRTLEDALGAEVRHLVPLDAKAARDSANQGVPALQLSPNSSISRAMKEMVDALYPTAAKKDSGLLGRLLGQGSNVMRLPGAEKHA